MIWVVLAAAIAAAVGRGSRAKSLLRQWIDEWRKHVHKHIDDDGRSAKATEILDRQEADLSEAFGTIGGTMAKISTVHREFDSTEGDYMALIDIVCETFAEVERGAVAAGLELRSTLSDEEWQAVQVDVQRRIDDYWAQQAKLEAKRAKKQARAER